MKKWRIDLSDKNFLAYAGLFIILFISYLPLSTFYFGMKNDAFSDNFPDKFFLSEAIHSGMNPLWNPYINFGFPVYADLGFAFWNPITWLFAVIGYNAYTLTAEVLLYLFIAGMCMYRLCRYLKLSEQAAFAAACMYMCSGFFVGSVQYINFITGAAFLPIALLALLRLFEMPTPKNSFLLALAWYMILAGGHPALPIGFVYFTVVFAGLYLFINKGYHNRIKQLIFYTCMAALMVIVFYFPAIYSYINLMPVYGRSVPETQNNLLHLGTSISSFISFVFPFFTAVSKNVFNADVAMRNVYFGISGFVLLFAAYKYKNKYVVPLFATAVFSLLLSMSGSVKLYIYDNLPLLNYIRTNGEFRVFSVLCFSAMAAFGIQQLAVKDEKVIRVYKFLLYLLLIFAIAVFLIALFTGSKVIEHDLVNINAAGTFSEQVKSFLGSSAQFFLCFSTAVAIAITLLSFYALKSKKQVVFIAVIVFDLMINSIIYLPVTGIGQVTLKNIQAIYNTSPEGIPKPLLMPINAIKPFDSKTTGLVGDISYYNKNIGTSYFTDYPSYFTSTADFFNAGAKDKVLKNPFLFLKSELNDSVKKDNISIKEFSPTHILITVEAASNDTLVFLQNDYKYWSSTVDGKVVNISPAYISFMSVPVKKGFNRVEFVYSDKWLYIFISISAIAFLTCFFVFYKNNIQFLKTHKAESVNLQ